MNATERKYFDDCMCDLQDVIDADKRLLIVSEGKSALAYETVVMMAERACIAVELRMLRCEDGELHEHAFVSLKRHPADQLLAASSALRGAELVEQAHIGLITRARLQFELGKLLGYPEDDILDFIASAVSRECPCDCCGGPFVNEKFFDTKEVES